MAQNIIAFPGRPRVRIGNTVYEVVEPRTLRAMIEAIAERVYGQAQLSRADQDAWFARTVAAAALNALTEADLQRSAPPASKCPA